MMSTINSIRVQAPASLIPLTAHDDATTSNPSGRVDADGAQKDISNNKLFRAKQLRHVSTLNVRTLNGHKINDLVSLAISTSQDIICVQEHRFLHADLDVKYHQLPHRRLLVTSSATTHSQNSTVEV